MSAVLTHPETSWERLAIPTVVAVQGLCFGGGFELAIGHLQLVRLGSVLTSGASNDAGETTACLG
jgi:hypothetical protein